MEMFYNGDEDMKDKETLHKKVQVGIPPESGHP